MLLLAMKVKVYGAKRKALTLLEAAITAGAEGKISCESCADYLSRQMRQQLRQTVRSRKT
jgi:hypothetical protein